MEYWHGGHDKSDGSMNTPPPRGKESPITSEWEVEWTPELVLDAVQKSKIELPTRESKPDTC
jgi:hypothetical protein